MQTESEEAMSVQLARHWFTVAQFNRMGETGILAADDRVELIEGEIVEMSPIGKRHAACIGRLTNLFGRQLSDEAIVWIQNPIILDNYSEPQPDVALLRWRDDFYERSLPGPRDVMLVIEVSDTTVESDRQVKLPLYARAGIPEVWLVNLPDAELEIYAQPVAGEYRTRARAGRNEEVRARSIADLVITVNAVLG